MLTANEEQNKDSQRQLQCLWMAILELKEILLYCEGTESDILRRNGKGWLLISGSVILPEMYIWFFCRGPSDNKRHYTNIHPSNWLRFSVIVFTQTGRFPLDEFDSKVEAYFQFWAILQNTKFYLSGLFHFCVDVLHTRRWAVRLPAELV